MHDDFIGPPAAIHPHALSSSSDLQLQYDCSMALAVARANAELQDVEAAVDAM